MADDVLFGANSSAGSERDLAATALILGFAAVAWFGWGQAQPPAGWSVPLAIGSAAGLAVAVAAGLTARRYRMGQLSMNDARIRRAYRRVVVTEVILCALGAVGLGLSGQSGYVAAWILLVVGAHFVPLGRLFAIGSLVVAGLVLVVVAAAAAVTGAASTVAPSFVAGAGGGAVCLACSVLCAWRALRPAQP
jgi:hypothetical protein